MNMLLQLKEYGQSVWLDHIDRDLIHGGGLKIMVDEGEICGLTTNPAILANAMGSDAGHAREIRALLRQGHTPTAAYEKLVIPEIAAAADMLRPVYENTHRRDGYVSLQVAPAFADDTAGTIAETRRLWRTVGRENLLIKIPATEAGIPAITQLTAEGININVTLLFSQALYERAAYAYLDGLEQLIACGGNPAPVASVASFFISRLDTAVDAIISSHLNQCGWIKTYNALERESLRNLSGKVAIANAKVAYERQQAIFSGPRWDALAAQGAQKQRLLWASTGIKNPAYRDVKYIEELIGPDTVTTIPPPALAAFRDHGRVRSSLQEDIASATAPLSTLKTLRIPLDDIASRLLSGGVKQFSAAYEKLIDAIPQPLP
ncbi:transaldolase [Nitrosospira sp. Nsp13]|uniref:transaldolase n=1 Tax=Nitrosospira sp. Nsp13 TaxID=1855332 RepID=UPI0008869DED|nr:transaldolase [Nitrosospira sp. Nsp13]SCX88806.1 transaldolase [Nitrosospira sp. Nsp13]